MQNNKGKFGKCYYGVKTALNEAFISQNDFAISENVKPIYEGKELKRWTTPEPEQKLILFKSKWTKEKYGADITEEKAIENLKRDYPQYINALIPFEHEAKKRFDKGDFWWELRNCAYYDLFERSKIIFPNLQNRNKFCFDDIGTYVNAPAVFIPTDSKALLAILNSKLVWYFLTSICVVRSGGYIEVKPQYFEQIPIPEIDFINENGLATKAVFIMDLITEVQSQSQKFQRTIQRKFEIKTLPKKLQDWYLLGYPEFIKELTKQKVKLNLSQEAEWEDYFTAEAKKILALKTEIETTEKAIDAMVYDLYDLTLEEIVIVEK